jgi:predicted metal-binding membrane protein
MPMILSNNPTTPPAARATQARDRLVIGSSLALVCILAWALTFWHGHATHETMPAAWHLSRVTAVFLMWLIMMVAMMLPSVFPVVDLFAAVNRQRHAGRLPYAATALFVGGYIVTWSIYSAAATGAHYALERSELIDTEMRATGSMLSGALFLAAGLYQWTTLKYACLARCRSPIGFMLTEWRDGGVGALVMGMRHGMFCVGCCAVLMALLFAVAVMDIAWVAVIATVVFIEKVLPGERFWRHAIGAGLTLTGVILIIRSLLT